MTSTTALECPATPEREYVFPQIVLTQAGTATPRTRTGPGTVVRGPDGALALRMAAVERVSLAEVFSWQGDAGALLPPDAFFDMAATDDDGRLWRSEQIVVSDKVDLSASGSDVRSILRSMSTDCASPQQRVGFCLELVVHTRAKIVCNDVESSNGAISSTKLSLVAPDGSRVAILQRDGHLLVAAQNDTHEVSVMAVSHLLDGLSIASGERMTVSNRYVRSPTLETTHVISIGAVPHGQSIWPPFDMRARRPAIAFVSAYARFCHEVESPFYDAWLHIVSAWEQGLMHAAFPLGVGIERLLRDLFADRMVETPPVLAAVEAMMTHLNSASVDLEMRKRGRGALGKIKGRSPSGALKALAAEGWIDESLGISWGAVRNRGAHGSSILKDETPEELQQGLDNLCRCLHLFYVLLLIRMGFTESFVDHSRRGFPLTEARQGPPTVSA